MACTLMANRKTKKVRAALLVAEDYATWREVAAELDRLEGLDEWRHDERSDLYHHELLKEHLNQMRGLRQAQKAEPLITLIEECLYRHLGEISNPALYQYAHSGTKMLIEDFLAEAQNCIVFLADDDSAGFDTPGKLHILQQAYHNFGRSALLLSGGLAFGIYHTGVVKALWEQQLLPNVISGSSMGSIVAAGVCSRNDTELDEFFAHPEQIHRRALRLAAPARMWRERLIMAPEQLMEHIDANVGSYTFAEAYQRSGRILNITVSPTRIHQKPRILNHMTAPGVLTNYAAQASCAIPGAFPPVQLKARDRAGHLVSYMETERWIDGSVHGDLPTERLGRLHNVNHTIVSQANPHVLPFLTAQKRPGLLAFAKKAASSSAHAQVAEILEITRGSWLRTPLRPTLDKAYAVARQSYVGDINIQFPFRPRLYSRVAANPDLDGLKLFIRLGEQATWPQIAMIRDQTRISRTFERCIARLTESG